MAMHRAETWNDDWVRKAFLEDYAWKPTFFDLMKPRRPTEDSIRNDVSELRSPSEAGRAWIADRRMAIASVGPWRDVFFLPRKAGGYPAIMIRARREGVTFEITTATKIT